MIYTPLTKKAINLIYEKHSGQFDKAGLPYVLHPIHVAESMDDETSTLVALLHDIVEDTDITVKDLIDLQFPLEVVETLKYLTYEDGVDYYKYIQNIGTNEIATKVKLADLKHNSDLSRLDVVTQRDVERVKKYKRCIDYLSEIQYEREQSKHI